MENAQLALQSAKMPKLSTHKFVDALKSVTEQVEVPSMTHSSIEQITGLSSVMQSG